MPGRKTMRNSKRNYTRKSKSTRVKRGGVAACENPIWTTGRRCPKHVVIPFNSKGPGYYHCKSCSCLTYKK